MKVHYSFLLCVSLFALSFTNCTIVRKKVLTALDKESLLGPNTPDSKWIEHYTYPDDIEINGLAGSSNTVLGITDHLAGIQVDEVLSVLMVHGMSTKLIDDYDDAVKLYDANLKQWATQQQLTYAEEGEFMLGIEALPDPDCKAKSSCDSIPAIKSYLRSLTFPEGKKYIHFAFCRWSPATITYKRFMEKMDQPDFRKPLANINRALKDEVVIDGLGDVAALNDARNLRKAHQTLEGALLLTSLSVEELLSISQGNNIAKTQTFAAEPSLSNTIFLSGSLGSKVMLDFLVSYEAVAATRFIGPAGAGGDLVQLVGENKVLTFNYSDASFSKLNFAPSDDTFYWYSMSNQFTLLSAIDLSINYLDNVANFTTKELQAAEQSMLARTDFVACYDPNDILGFNPKQLFHNPDVKPRTHVAVRIPVAPRINLEVVNPQTAHSNIKDHPYFGHLFINGYIQNDKPLPEVKDLVKLGKFDRKGVLDGFFDFVE